MAASKDEDRSMHSRQIDPPKRSALPHRVGVDASKVDPPSVDLDEEQHIETPKQHGVNGEEIAGEHLVRGGELEAALRDVRVKANWL